MSVVLRLARKVFSIYKNFKLRRLGTEPVWQRVPAGFEMLITPTEWLDQRMLFGVYEPWLVRLVQGVVQPGDVCLDIGTHKGYFTMLMAKQTGPQGRVLAFDPDPRVFERLDQNCRRNGYDWVERFPLALGETQGNIELELNPKPGDSSRFHRQSVALEQAQRVTVPMKTLDQVVEETGFFQLYNEISFIKMDAEGSEPLIWQGMKKTLERCNPAIFLELNFECLEAAGTDAQEWSRRLRMEGWEIYRIGWMYDALYRGRIRMEPLAFRDEEKDTIDTLLIRPNSPYRGRLEIWIDK